MAKRFIQEWIQALEPWRGEYIFVSGIKSICLMQCQICCNIMRCTWPDLIFQRWRKWQIIIDWIKIFLLPIWAIWKHENIALSTWRADLTPSCQHGAVLGVLHTSMSSGELVLDGHYRFTNLGRSIRFYIYCFKLFGNCVLRIFFAGFDLKGFENSV